MKNILRLPGETAMDLKYMIRAAFSWIADNYARLAQRFLPYLLAAFAVFLVVQIRWETLDSKAFFIVGQPARRDYYAVKDDIFLDRETTRNIRKGASDRIIGVLVKGDIQTEIGFNEECNLLLNDPISDTILPEELRNLLDEMTLDKREQIITVVRQVHDALTEQGNSAVDQKSRARLIWHIIREWKSEPVEDNIIFQIVSAIENTGPQFDEALTKRMKDSAARDIAFSRRVIEKGARIIEKGAVVTPEIAQILKRNGYPEGKWPFVSLICSMWTGLFSMFWITKTIRRTGVTSSYSREWLYPCFLLIAGWFLQLGAVCLNINGLGILPVIAIACLTLPEVVALSSTTVIIFSASIIASGTDLTCFTINLLAGCTGAFAGVALYRKNYSRSEVLLHVLIQGGGILFAALLLQIGLVGVPEPLHQGFMLIACLALSFSVLFILPLLESVFDIVSPLQLVELTQPSHPLLKRLQIEAPGTYYHSQMVGNLAEAAAEKIGLNPMLLRAGACFHDIGKLRRPQYFIENQFSGTNGHDVLSPALSALLIISHVKDGLEIADDYHLPSQIKAFISEHHGMTCLSYFYKKALQAGLKVNEAQFSYPGPKPQSKETALLMLSDSTEAAARAGRVSIKNVNDLAQLVDGVVASKINSGQLDEVSFTLKEITEVKKALVERLRSMYHTRDIKPLNDAVPAARKDLTSDHERPSSV